LEQHDNLTEISDSLDPSFNQSTRHNIDVATVMKIDSRFLMDCSNSESGSVLNNPDVKDKVIQRYDRIEHCTIREMVQSWYEFAMRKTYRSRGVVYLKMILAEPLHKWMLIQSRRTS
jgi:hypothetical protein